MVGSRGLFDHVTLCAPRLCRGVSPNDHDNIGMIGVSPLEDLIHRWEDEALALVEAGKPEKQPRAGGGLEIGLDPHADESREH